jgi:nucleoside-diphosphate-sugar epimerase
MRSEVTGPVNVGSGELISINALANLIAQIAGKTVRLQNIPGPVGVRGRSSDNNLVAARLGWSPRAKLADGLQQAYEWISLQVADAQSHG